MRLSIVAVLAALSPLLASASPVDAVLGLLGSKLRQRPQPKVFIISMFSSEAEIWYDIPEFNLLARNITVPGFSPLFPDAHCTASGEVCLLVTGEGGERTPS